MTPRNKQENALGKGLDALIRREYLDEEDKKSKKPEETETKPDSGSASKEGDAKSGTPLNSEDSPQNQGSQILTVDKNIVDAVLIEVHKNPRISLWSAKSAAVLRYLKKTKPEFSISNEASLLIEEAVKDKHPDVWKIFEEKRL